MASSTRPTRSSVAHENSRQSSLGTHAPLNTPTRRFYPSQERLEVHTPGIPNPNVYVVQPFKNASVPKDFVYSKKSLPNPGEELLNSTIQLINHFTTCYEAVKQQLQEEHNRERESVLVSRTLTIGETSYPPSRNYLQKPAKQARLRPLMVQQNQTPHHGPMIEQCVGISPVPAPRADDLAQVYDEKLRLLRKMKPEYFDSQGNLLSNNRTQSSAYSQPSAPCSKKSATSSGRTPHNTLLTNENAPFDEHRTFLTEFTTEEEDERNEGKPVSLDPNEQTNQINELMKNNYVLKVLEIKKVSSASSKRDPMKSASEKLQFTKKGNHTAKST